MLIRTNFKGYWERLIRAIFNLPETNEPISDQHIYEAYQRRLRIEKKRMADKELILTPALLRYYIHEELLKQDDIAKALKVSKGAVSRAINQDKDLASLRKQIIEFVKSYKPQSK